MNLLIRNVTAQDSEEVFTWRNEIGVRRFSQNQDPIIEEIHTKWFLDRLKRVADEPFMIFEHGAERVGFVRFDFDAELDQFAISIIVNPLFRGKGYGKTILKKAIEKVLESNPKAVFYAEVHCKNQSSKSLFLNAGFQELSTKNNFLIFNRFANFY